MGGGGEYRTCSYMYVGGEGVSTEHIATCMLEGSEYRTCSYMYMYVCWLLVKI